MQWNVSDAFPNDPRTDLLFSSMVHFIVRQVFQKVKNLARFIWEGIGSLVWGIALLSNPPDGMPPSRGSPADFFAP